MADRRSSSTGRRIGVVTTHPPGSGSLNEYGLHLVAALAHKPEVEEVVVLADELPEGMAYTPPPGARVVPCWAFNSLRSAITIVRAARRADLDAVVWSLQFASFGDRRVPAALGLLAPLLARVAGLRNIILLHHLMETVDLGGAGFSMSRVAERVTRGAGWLVTKALVLGGRVAVTMPQYLDILRDRYGAVDVAVIPHGTFDNPELDVGHPEDRLRLLAFGKFGTYKRVEPLIDAAARLQDRFPVEVVVAGRDSPNAAGYLADVQRRHPDVTFTGYVPEQDIPALFRSAAVAVFPYTHTTGSSGVVHQAASYSRALVMPEIGDFRRLVEAEGYRGVWFDPQHPESLDAALHRILADDELRVGMGRHNHGVATAMPISEVADWYLDHVDDLVAANSLLEVGVRLRSAVAYVRAGV